LTSEKLKAARGDTPTVPERPRLLLFDLDGTLISPGTDFAAMREEVRNLFVRAGVPQDFPFRHILGGLDDAATFLRKQGRDARDVEALRAQAYDLIERREREGLAMARAIPGVREALQAWRANYHVGIFTRTHPDVLRESIAKFDLGDFHVLLSRADGPPKPDPAQVRLALARAGGLMPNQAVVVGDHVFDIQAGKAAGVRSFGVLTGSGTREALLEAGAEDVLPAVPDLAARLR
jgi:HAD superfamily hydrolase (TIGR01509 family)